MIFLLANLGDAFMNLRSAAWNLVQGNHLIWSVESMSKPKNEPWHKPSCKPTNDQMNHQTSNEIFNNWNMMYYFLTTFHQNEWLSVASKISKSRAIVLICVKLNWLPTPLIHSRQSVAWIVIVLITEWTNEWHSFMCGLVRSKAIVMLLSLNLDQTNGRCQIKSILILQVSRTHQKSLNYIIFNWPEKRVKTGIGVLRNNFAEVHRDSRAESVLLENSRIK